MLFLFDIDGTLLKTENSGSKALGKAFLTKHSLADATRGYDPSGKTDSIIISELFSRNLQREPSEKEIADLLDNYLLHLADVLTPETTTVLPGVHEALQYLKENGHYLAVGTGNIKVAALRKLAAAGLTDWFAVGGYGCDARERCHVLLAAASRATEKFGQNFAKQDIFVVGDTTLDISAAKLAGLPVLAVATGGSSFESLVAENPNAVFRTLHELPTWVRDNL